MIADPTYLASCCHDREQTQEYPLQYENMLKHKKNQITAVYYCSKTQHNALPEQRQKITYWNLCHDREQAQEYPMQYENMFKRMKNQITKENDTSNVLGSYDCGS